ARRRVHIWRAFMGLPLYASMRAIDPDYVRAAANLGASPVKAFWQVYVPLSVPGLIAGIVIVFVLCLGFYVTPALLGGGRVMMWSMQIERNVSYYDDWGAASALGVVLLVLTLGILWLLDSRYLAFPPPAWSVRWYVAYFSAVEWREATYVSFAAAILTMLLSTVFATLAAYGLHSLRN